MKRGILGATGISVSELGLGTMMLGARGNADHNEWIRMIHTALDAGVNLVDTADVYSRGEAEEIVGRALKGGGTTWCWRPSSGCRWAPTPTSKAPHRAGSGERWRTACAGSAPTTWTSTSSTGPTRTPPSRTGVFGAVRPGCCDQGKVRAMGILDLPPPS